MREEGLEPSHPFGHRHLKPARLPIPPLARGALRKVLGGAYRNPRRLRQGYPRRRGHAISRTTTRTVGRRRRRTFLPRRRATGGNWAPSRARDGRFPFCRCEGAVRCCQPLRGPTSETDLARFADVEESLVRELCEAAREAARDDGWNFMGPVQVVLIESTDIRPGQCASTPA